MFSVRKLVRMHKVDLLLLPVYLHERERKMEGRDQIMNKGKRRRVKVKGTKRKNFTSPQAIALRDNLKNGEEQGKRLALYHITYFFTLLHVKTNRPQET